MATFKFLYDELTARLRELPGRGQWVIERRKALVNQAIDHWWTLGGHRVLVDKTLTTEADTIEYELPAEIPHASAVVEIRVQTDTGYGSPPEYTLVGDSPVQMILDEAFTDADKTILIIYRAPYPQLTSDSDETLVPTGFVIAWAQYLAHMELANLVTGDPRAEHLAMADKSKSEAEAFMIALPRPAQVENKGSGW